MKTGYRAALAAGLLVATLAGCSRSEPEEVASENMLSEEPPAPIAEPAPLPAAETSVPEAAAPEPLPAPSPEPTVEPDAQMLDDADATGMTARVQRDEATTNDADPQ